MRPEIRAFVESAASCFELRGPILEFGSFQVAGQETMGNLRPLFAGLPYVGCDMRPGPGVDRIEDVSRLSLADNSAATIICLETLEHVFEVRRAVDELIRVLAPGGTLLISIPFYFHIHAHPSDYWRITPHCLAGLLEPLAARLVGYQGVATTPHTVYAIAAKSPLPIDFESRAARFVDCFEQNLAELERSAPLVARARRRVRELFVSKGERRRRQRYYQAHFELHPATHAAIGRTAA